MKTRQIKSKDRLFGLLVAAVFVACGGDDAGNETQTPDEVTPAASSSTLPDRDPSLASSGEELFTTRACVSCHTVGAGRLVGPDLEGVTERRSREWIVAMIVNPDSMLRADTTARRLLGEYFTPMVNQGISTADAAAMYEFLATKGTDAGNEGGAD